MNKVQEDAFKKRFRETLRSLRRDRTQIQLAGMLDTAQSNLSHYERLTQMPSPKIIENVAHEIGASMGAYYGYLYGEANEVDISTGAIEDHLKRLPLVDRVRLCKMLVADLEEEVRRMAIGWQDLKDIRESGGGI